MDQIAAELAISKRTIYELFKDKNDLVYQCIENMGRSNYNELHEIIARADNVIEALYLIGQHREKKRAGINHLFFDDVEKSFPNLRKLFVKGLGPGQKPVTYTILKRGIKEGIFRKELNIDIVDVFIHEMMRICHSSDIFPKDSPTNEILWNIVIPYFRGISTEKGKELIEKHFPLEHI